MEPLYWMEYPSSYDNIAIQWREYATYEQKSVWLWIPFIAEAFVEGNTSHAKIWLLLNCKSLNYWSFCQEGRQIDGSFSGSCQIQLLKFTSGSTWNEGV